VGLADLIPLGRGRVSGTGPVSETGNPPTELYIEQGSQSFFRQFEADIPVHVEIDRIRGKGILFSGDFLTGALVTP